MTGPQGERNASGLDLFKQTYGNERQNTNLKYQFLLLTQFLLLGLLGYEVIKDMRDDFETMAFSTNIVLARFICVVFLHLQLANEI